MGAERRDRFCARVRNGGASAVYADPHLSPDGRQLALAIIEAGNTDIWVHDVAAGRRTRLTFDPAEMSKWMRKGEKKAEAVIKKSPFV